MCRENVDVYSSSATFRNGLNVFVVARIGFALNSAE